MITYGKPHDEARGSTQVVVLAQKMHFARATQSIHVVAMLHLWRARRRQHNKQSDGRRCQIFVRRRPGVCALRRTHEMSDERRRARTPPSSPRLQKRRPSHSPQRSTARGRASKKSCFCAVFCEIFLVAKRMTRFARALHSASAASTALRNRKPLFLSIEGNIGAGKTTLAERLASRLPAKLFQEPVTANPYLSDFYASTQATWGLMCQIVSFCALFALGSTACASTKRSKEVRAQDAAVALQPSLSNLSECARLRRRRSVVIWARRSSVALTGAARATQRKRRPIRQRASSTARSGATGCLRKRPTTTASSRAASLSFTASSAPTWRGDCSCATSCSISTCPPPSASIACTTFASEYERPRGRAAVVSCVMPTRRAQPYEAGITLDYLAGLERHYESFLVEAAAHTSVVRVDWSRYGNVDDVLALLRSAVR